MVNLPALAAAAAIAFNPLQVQSPAPVLVPGAPPAPIVTVDKTGAAKTWDEALAELATAKIVAVGEMHDQSSHHQVQAEALTGLASRVPSLVVGLEMVCYEEQKALDDFMAGRTSEAAFAAWWQGAWGFDYLLYKPIFDAAKAAGVPVYGLNAPITVVKAVSAGGLSSLPAAERARLPASVAQSDDARYKAFVLMSVAGHGTLTPAQIQNRLESMAVWNETMGEKAAALAASGKTVLVIAGQGHVFYGAGVLESAARRGAGAGKALLAFPLDGGSVPIPDQLRELRDTNNGYLELSDWFRLIP